ncbi:MAG: V-type ATP synthase subunit K [Treponema sp.]|nr:V-type ATP synthase subunit K [Treponema sp.]
MEMGLLGQLGVGLSFAIPAIGAAIAMGLGGPAVIGAYKKCYVQNKKTSFLFLVFAGTSLTNVLYGLIVALMLTNSVQPDGVLLLLGLGAGLSIGIVAITQSMCSAAAAEALAETGKGSASFLIVIGIAETVSIFAMAFAIALA